MDNFQTPKEFIASILCETGPLQIYDSVSEHGHMWDVFQENYLDSRGVDVTKATEAFSEADMYDNHMYADGEWNLMPYFVLNSLTIPKSALGEPLQKDKIRPEAVGQSLETIRCESRNTRRFERSRGWVWASKNCVC